MNKQNRKRLIDREQDDSCCWGRLGDQGIEQKGKRTHGHGQRCGDCCWARDIRGLCGNGKKYNKDSKLKNE